jgi:hypothetical protein
VENSPSCVFEVSLCCAVEKQMCVKSGKTSQGCAFFFNQWVRPASCNYFFSRAFEWKKIKSLRLSEERLHFTPFSCLALLVLRNCCSLTFASDSRKAAAQEITVTQIGSDKHKVHCIVRYNYGTLLGLTLALSERKINLCLVTSFSQSRWINGRPTLQSAQSASQAKEARQKAGASSRARSRSYKWVKLNICFLLNLRWWKETKKQIARESCSAERCAPTRSLLNLYSGTCISLSGVSEILYDKNFNVNIAIRERTAALTYPLIRPSNHWKSINCAKLTQYDAEGCQRRDHSSDAHQSTVQTAACSWQCKLA